MIELRFRRDLYAAAAVDEAAEAFAALAAIDRADDDDALVLHVTPRYPKHSRRILGELRNYALAKTIDRGGAP
ncbi:MAG: HxsD-like protein [Myxococcales bacterium]|nr:HxsD-like protein [Myxococcales bacterium]